MHPGYRRLIVAVLLPLYLGACTQWTVQPVSPKRVQALTEQEEPPKIRVTLADSTRLELEDFSMDGDSIAGRPRVLVVRRPNGAKLGSTRLLVWKRHPRNDKVLYGLVGAAVIGVVVLVLASAVEPVELPGQN